MMDQSRAYLRKNLPILFLMTIWINTPTFTIFTGNQLQELTTEAPLSSEWGYQKIASNLSPLNLLEIMGNLAVTSSNNYLYLYSISSPALPRLIKQIAEFPETIVSMQLEGVYLFVACSQNGVWIFDLSDPYAPLQVGRYDPAEWIYDIDVQAQRLYLGLGNYLRVLDVNQPDNIYELGSKMVNGGVSSVQIQSNKAYLVVSGMMNRDFVILDVSIPTNIQQIGLYPTFLNAIFVDGNYAYLVANAKLMILDISNPANMILVNSEYSVYGSVSEMQIDGNFLYLVYFDGLQILEVSDPTSPHLVGGLSGDRFNHISIDNSLVYLTSNRGVISVDITNPKLPVRLNKNLLKFLDKPQVIGDRFFGLLTDVGDLQTLNVSEINGESGMGLMPFNLRAGLPACATDYAIRGTIAYIACYGGDLRVLDISSPKNHFEIGMVSVLGSAQLLTLAPDYIYVYSYKDKQGHSLQIFNLANPTSPVWIGSFPLSYRPEMIAYHAGLLFLTEYAKGVHVLSLADPAKPVELNIWEVKPDQIKFFEQNLIIYEPTQHEIQIWDLSNPLNITKIGSIAVSYYLRAFTNYGSLVYLLDGGNHLLVYDIANPASPLKKVDQFLQISGYVTSLLASEEWIYLQNTYGGFDSYRRLPNFTEFDIGDSGGNFQVENIRYDFQPGTVSAAILRHQPRHPDLLTTPRSWRNLGIEFESNVRDAINGYGVGLNKPITLSVGYDPGAIYGWDESSLGIYRWSGAGWGLENGSTVDLDNHKLVATPSNLGRWGVFATSPSPAGSNRTHLAHLARRQLSAQNLVLQRLELTQAIQTPNQTIPLVKGRSTLLRAYAFSQNNRFTEDVFLRVEGWRAGNPLPGSPLLLGPFVLGAQSLQNDLDSTINYFLPDGWSEGQVELKVTLEKRDGLFFDDPADNTLISSFTFSVVPPLMVVIVPIDYTYSPTGQRYPPIVQEEIKAGVVDRMPVGEIQIQMHAPLLFTGNLAQSDEWGRLLNRVTDLRNSEKPPKDVVYYGVIPPNPSGLAWAGMGWIGLRASIGINSGGVAAHEMGHNFGLGHMPCGVTDSDPKYPYEDAFLGDFGFGTENGFRLHKPWIDHDMMSYCGDKVSTYSYLAFMEDQIRQGSLLDGRPVPSLWLRASILADGSLEFRPGYILSVPVNQEVSPTPYRIEFLDGGGQIISENPIQIYQAEEMGDVHQAINTFVPLPDREPAFIQVWNGEELLFEKTFSQESGLPISADVDAGSDAALWQLTWEAISDAPVLVRYASDSGNLWATLVIDYYGSSLKIDPDLLPNITGEFQILPAVFTP